MENREQEKPRRSDGSGGAASAAAVARTAAAARRRPDGSGVRLGCLDWMARRRDDEAARALGA